MAKFVTNASGAMLLPNLVQVTESISGSVVPLAMFTFICNESSIFLSKHILCLHNNIHNNTTITFTVSSTTIWNLEFVSVCGISYTKDNVEVMDQCDVSKSSHDSNKSWREVKQMQLMWLWILSGKWFNETFENAHWRKIKQMQPMWLCILLWKYETR